MAFRSRDDGNTGHINDPKPAENYFDYYDEEEEKERFIYVDTTPPKRCIHSSNTQTFLLLCPNQEQRI